MRASFVRKKAHVCLTFCTFEDKKKKVAPSCGDHYIFRGLETSVYWALRVRASLTSLHSNLLVKLVTTTQNSLRLYSDDLPRVRQHSENYRSWSFTDQDLTAAGFFFLCSKHVDPLGDQFWQECITLYSNLTGKTGPFMKLYWASWILDFERWRSFSVGWKTSETG